MLDFFASDIKLQAIHKVIHTSNYDGHISKYVCKIGKYKSKRGNNSNKMLDGVVFSCQQIGVNTFYKCVEFQVNSFELLRNFNYTKKISLISMYYVETRADNSGHANHRVTCLVVMGSHLIVNRYVEFHFNAYHNY
jgi:hypothetical protein